MRQRCANVTRRVRMAEASIKRAWFETCAAAEPRNGEGQTVADGLAHSDVADDVRVGCRSEGE